jgi:2-polyprenyl-6-hydroxyphenyl methylase/3-demethylubiquinone-9 3-methyltransferase
MTTRHATELHSGERFSFGNNWANFLNVLNEARINEAEQSLRRMLNVEHLRGKRVLDVGSGSGLFSLAARRLGATVHSFDYDPESVACTKELRRRNDPTDDGWTVESGSVLDEDYLSTLGTWDIVYSWGVLHHTGEMWVALSNVAPLVAPGGRLFISIYNDQGGLSVWWRSLKRIYNRLPKILRKPYTLAVMGPLEFMRFIGITAHSRDPRAFFRKIRNYGEQNSRGMSYWHDIVDWIGGYPFEVATPGAIFDFYAAREFQLSKLKTCGGRLGCNEYVFRRPLAHA